MTSILAYTPDLYEFNQWHTVDTSTKFVFRVRAKNDAHLVFGSIPGNFDGPTYQLVLGGHGNQRCYLRSQIEGTELLVRIF